MAKYFNFFSKTLYTNGNSNDLDVVTNIISRFAFESTLKENTSAYYEYEIRDSDTPEIIAEKYYNNPERHWIVLLFNDIIDPQYDWPLADRNLIRYIDKKYSANGGLSWAKNINNVQAYYKVSTRTSDFDRISLEERFQITKEDYANTGTSSVVYSLQDGSTVTETITTEYKTFYDYEIEENEKKRKISLLKPEFIDSVEKEFKRVIK
ncbi:baseplate wedge protein 53 [Candidatus Dojkabacteria bacterium]|jgi:hypothetical protein|nr:baseplate wedge protein 53 [Candidatus Dojkabacteria bacterium]